MTTDQLPALKASGRLLDEDDVARVSLWRPPVSVLGDLCAALEAAPGRQWLFFWVVELEWTSFEVNFIEFHRISSNFIQFLSSEDLQLLPRSSLLTRLTPWRLAGPCWHQRSRNGR